MNKAEYRRLVRILTARACRALNVATAKGEDWVLADPASPLPTLFQRLSSSGPRNSFSSVGRPRHSRGFWRR